MTSDALSPSDGTELPRLPDLPDPASLTRAHAEGETRSGGEAAQPEDELPTPPQWPAISAGDIRRVHSVSDSPPVAQPAFQMPAQPPTRPARPPVRDAEPGLLGLTRRSRTRVGRLAFKWIFVVIFAVILIQMISTLLTTR